MSSLQTAEAAGVNGKLDLRDVLQRTATETDQAKLPPQARNEHFEIDVQGRRNEILEMLLSDQRV
jgi:hypothetical protein